MVNSLLPGKKSRFPDLPKLLFGWLIPAMTLGLALATDTTCDGTTQDPGGYVCSRSGPASWIPSIVGTGTPVTVWSPKGCPGDDCYKLVNLPPGKVFHWYGNPYQSVYIGSNGYLSFETGYADPADTLSIPTAAPPNNAVYGYGHDLVPDSASDLVYYLATTCPFDLNGDATDDECFVVEWDQVPFYDPPESNVTFRMALDLSSNDALVFVVDESGAVAASAPRVVGSENLAGSTGLWLKLAGQPDSQGATAGDGFVFSPEKTPPQVLSTTPPDDALDVPLAQSVVITFSEPMDTASVALQVRAGTNPGNWSATWSDGDRTAAYTHNPFTESEPVILQVSGVDRAGNPLPLSNQGGGTCPAGYCWNFTTEDLTAPSDVRLLTAATRTHLLTLEWEDSISPDAAGILILRKAGAPVDDRPEDGVAYTIGEIIGSGNQVVALAGIGAGTWIDSSLPPDIVYHYKAFAHDASFNYSPGIPTTGWPREIPYFWTLATQGGNTTPPGPLRARYSLGANTDTWLFRMNSFSGEREDWEPYSLGSPAAGQPQVFLREPPSGPMAYVSTRNGWLYQFQLDFSSHPTQSWDVLATAGCPGELRASPAVILDALDNNLIPGDDAVVQATACGPNDNRIIVFPFWLNQGPVVYDGNGGLGPSFAAPAVFYPSDGKNLAYIPLQQNTNELPLPGKSLVVLAVEATPDGTLSVEPYAVVRGKGDLGASPVVLQDLEGKAVVLAGNTAGELYLFDALARESGAGSPLLAIDSFSGAAGDGPVKGLSAARATGGDPALWVAWSTDTLVHAMKVGEDGRFDAASYRQRTLSAPSAPLALPCVNDRPSPLLYVGGGDGHLYELDPETAGLDLLRQFAVDPGSTLSTPVYERISGFQLVLVGSGSGRFHAIAVASSEDADSDGYSVCEGDCNSFDPGINPGATDVCDGQDDDCDGMVDEGYFASFRDADGDGFGDPATMANCSLPPGYVTNHDDCDDHLRTSYPGAPEICGDDSDTDCDGTSDAGETECRLAASHLRFVPGSRELMEWDAAPAADAHALYRGKIGAEGMKEYSHHCAAAETIAPQAGDARLPLPGEVLYYLATGLSIDPPTGTITAGPLGYTHNAAILPESTKFPCGARVYVDPDAVGLGNGLSWPHAYTTVSAALGHGRGTGRSLEIWMRGALLESNVYAETWPGPGIVLLGGFAGGEEHSWQRQPATHPTTWHGEAGIALFSSWNNRNLATDGLTLGTGNYGLRWGACTNCLVDLFNTRFDAFSEQSVYIGVSSEQNTNGRLAIENCNFSGNPNYHLLLRARDGTLTGRILGNSFTGGAQAAIDGWAFSDWMNATLSLDIFANTLTGARTGIHLVAYSMNEWVETRVAGSVISNLIHDNSQDGIFLEAQLTLGGPGFNIGKVFSSPFILNNTLANNPAHGLNCAATLAADSGGPWHQVQVVPQVWNNLFTGQANGLIAETTPDATPFVYADPWVIANGMYGSTKLYLDEGFVYFSSILDVNRLPGARDNWKENPLLDGGFHLQPGSPAIDRGDPDAALTCPIDLDGQRRQRDGNGDGVEVPDAGADER